MFEVNDEELEAVKKVLLSKKLFRYQGPQVETECSRFEDEFAHFLGSPFSVLVTSGTASLKLALKLLEIGPGDEVILPCYTFFATPLSVLQVGALPILANIDQGLGLSPRDVERKITARTKAIIVVHMDGLSADLDALVELSKKHQIPLIEDVSQAIGGSYKGTRLGGLGDFGCFSFNVDKLISCGEGGALTAKDGTLRAKALLLHDTCAQFGSTHKDELRSFGLVGDSMRVSEISGAIMRIQLKKISHILEGLRERKKIFLRALDDVTERVVLSHDSDGDCGTSLHLKCADPFEVSELTRSVTQFGLKSLPLVVRPGHVFWQWQDLLRPGALTDVRLDPYKGHEDKSLKNSIGDLGPSKLLLSSLLKISINYDLSLQETALQATSLAKLLDPRSRK